jgi:tetratricopeptide (TPR) repeat protein
MLRRLTRVDPTDPSHWRTLISRLDETGIQSDTIAVMREALAAAIPQPEKSRIRQELAGTLMLLGEAEEARKELEPLLAEAGRPASADLLLVKLLRLEGQPERALSLLEEILPRLGSGSSDGAAQRAMLLIDLRRYEEALPILEQVVADEPFDQFAHFKLADVYRALGQAERAGRHAQLAAEIKQKRLRIHTLTKQAAQDPSNRQLFEELAELHRELNDNEAAVKWEQRAASPRP